MTYNYDQKLRYNCSSTTFKIIKLHTLTIKFTLYVIKYTPDVSDISWAMEGVVVVVSNGESIPLVQQRILDAGFENLIIIPMGADKVFLKATSDLDVRTILSGASDFFQSFFSSSVTWKID